MGRQPPESNEDNAGSLFSTALPPNRTEQERRWLVDNAEAIRRENEAIERDGLPLAKYRPF